ncbi:MAG: hypothetical protein H6779_00950 [Candidatus Nomurabacteria bacterium]|nr:hypothetical protein [Candidatus Nomurabacteria bacterium]USN87998.1 MAG: hypothetical protein H6779_00950 [Candidatus Nomurabacteria bacterium]
MEVFFSVAPTLFNFIGTIVIAWGLLITKEKALELGISRWSSDDEEENLKLPAISDRIKQRNFAIVGLILLTIGLIIELIGTLCYK